MSNTLFRARWLAPALLLALAGCGAPPTESRLAAHQAQVDPPMLWRVEALDADGRPSAALTVCADSTLREGFSRATAEVAGQPCLPMKDRVEKEGVFAVRCELNGQRFGLTVNRSGDPERDFQVAFAMKPLDGTGAGARQVRRFRRIGPCPAGWGIGDQARLSEPRGVNALAGAWRGE
jgi:hypothetical protein